MAKSISYTTKKPTGLSLKRSGHYITISWKKGDKDYGAGQTLQYRYPKGKWHTVSIGTTTTKKTIQFSTAAYCPNTNKPLSKLFFRIRGKRRDYTTGTGAKQKSYTCKVSEWAEKDYDIYLPNKPTLSATLNGTYNNISTFTWSVANANDSARWFTSVQCQTRLVTNSNITDGSKLSAGGWTAYSATAASGSATITEDTSVINTNVSHTRWFRVRARGPQGSSAWAYAYHVYAIPFQTRSVKASAKTTAAGGYLCTVKWTTPKNEGHPVDSINVQYAFATPASGLACPDSASWTDSQTLAYKDGSDTASFSIDSVVGFDQCLYVRINTIHDRNTTYGAAARAAIGALTPPSGVSVTADVTDYTATIEATNESAMGTSFLAVRYYSKAYPKGAYIGVIPHGSTSVTVRCPKWSSGEYIKFGVQAIVGSARITSRADGVTSYAIKASAYSQFTFDTAYGGSVPKAPETVTLSTTDVEGTVHVTYDCPWSSATGAELSWADHSDAWESTDEPSTFELSDAHVSGWNIGGLAVGKTWYVRVRLFLESDGNITYSEYSPMESIDLSSTPTVPVMALSNAVITEDGNVTASWTFASTDGTPQVSATVAQVEDGVYTKLAEVETAQHVTISASDAGWTTGEVYDLVVSVTSESGKQSDWSDPVSIHIAEPLVISIDSTSLVEQTITVDEIDRTVMSLTEMPLTATITGAGTGGTTRLIIERAETYHMARPDEREYNGFEGETVLIYSQLGEAAISITNDDLIGRLDDGASYRLIATIQDGLGQSAESTIDFEVHWTHQAIIPEATVVIDSDNLVAQLTPVAPDGALTTDVCDIYRLSADRPELIYPDAVFGTTYVDPYPTIGEHGGHRFVFKTANGDYITADDEIAWTDTREPEDDIVESDYNVINFGAGRVELAYNVDLSHTWEKDFTESKYLGGSVVGDWNPAVSRTGSLSTVVVSDDEETIESLRRLAVYAGICHVRTKDGSSYPADVQVSESYSQDSAHKIIEFELTITRVDSEGYDGMTLAEWQETEGE